MKYIYPQLSVKKSQDLGLFRLGGPGLANCLFVGARAHIRAKREGLEMLRPTWERFGLGQWIRGEKDKRLYQGLFKCESLWKRIRKAFLIRFSKQVVVEEGLGRFFEDIIDDHEEVVKWFYNSIEPEAIKNVPLSMKDSIAVHIRLGDFPEKLRMPNSWYKELLMQARAYAGREIDIQVFSDGTDDELKEILEIPGAHRVFYGNALADIVAISRCGMLIGGSYSTFATWGAFLGQIPSVFPFIDYGRIIKDTSIDCRVGNSTHLPEVICQRVFQ